MKIGMKMGVVGAGAWGTALAVQAATRHAVTLLVRDAAQLARMQATRENAHYLPGIALPESLHLVPAGIHETIEADLWVIATPLSGLGGWLHALAARQTPVVWLCKGFDEKGLLAHEMAAQSAPELVANPDAGVAVLSGPSFAQEVAAGQPTALVAASHNAALRKRLVEAFHTDRLRVYANDDIVGVEVGGAVKNVLAIATGLCDGLQLGLNARAALITRGLAEMMRLGVALGAKAETFMGLSGLGDLVLTATGDLSRNRKVGLMLAQGQSLEDITASLGHVAEGARCALALVARAKSLGVEMPIAHCVAALLGGQLRPDQAVQLLMQREPTVEAPSP
jgi:glycerol-3-phosphate dehydrogenase (NAD(P)+)